MKIHLKNGERVRTPKKNNNQIRNNKDNVKKRTPKKERRRSSQKERRRTSQKERRRTSQKERRRTSKKERRRTSKKERRRTFRKKRNQIYIKHGGMGVNKEELSNILSGQDFEDLESEDIKKITEIIMENEYENYDDIIRKLHQLKIGKQGILNELKSKISGLEGKSDERSTLKTTRDVKLKELKESEIEFEKDKRNLLNANDPEKKLSGDSEINHVSELKDEFMNTLLTGKGAYDRAIIKRIFRKLSVRKLINDEDGLPVAEDDDGQIQNGGGEVYYYYLNTDSRTLLEIFNNISMRPQFEDGEGIFDSYFPGDPQKFASQPLGKIKEDLNHIFNNYSENKRIFKIPPYFIKTFIEIAINTRGTKEYGKEHLDDLESMIGYSDKDKKLEILDDKLKESKKKIEKDYKYLKETRKTLDELTKKVSELRAEVKQLEKTKGNEGDDMVTEEELKDKKEKIITEILKIELATMKVNKTEKELEDKQKLEAETTRRREEAMKQKIAENIKEINEIFLEINESYNQTVKILESDGNITEKITTYKRTDEQMREKIRDFHSVDGGSDEFTNIKEELRKDIVEMETNSKGSIIKLLETEINRIQGAFDESTKTEDMNEQEYEIIASEIDSISNLEQDIDLEITGDMKQSIDELIKKKDKEKEAIASRSFVFSKDFRFGDIVALHGYFQKESKYKDFYKQFGGKSPDKTPWESEDPKEAMLNCIIIPFINYAKNDILQHKFIGKINSLKIPDLKTLSDKEIKIDGAGDPSMKRYFTRTYNPIGQTGIFSNSIYYILDQLFITPKLVLSKALADGTPEETDPLDKILKELSGDKLKNMLGRPQININNDRDTRLFNIEMSDSFLELQDSEPETANSLKENFDKDRPDSFHIRTFIDLLESMGRAEGIGPTELENMYILVVPIIFNKYYYNYSMTKNVIASASTTPTLTTELDKLIQDNVNGNIVTYLKIRNEKKFKDLNPRFKFKFMKGGKYANNSSIEEAGPRDVNSPKSWSPIQELYLRYNADKAAVRLGDKWDGKDPIVWSDSKSWMESIKENGKIKEPMLKYDYVFGKFTEIFTPDDKPPVITQRMKYGGIIEKLKSGEPLFILGYGASGSGKTSTLINLKDGDTSQQGILIELCNILGKDENYKNIKIKSKEYFTNINPDETPPPECKPFTDEKKKYTDIDFGNEGGLFKCNMDGVDGEVDGVKFVWDGGKFVMDPLGESKNYDSMFHQHRFTPVNNKLSSQGRNPDERRLDASEFRNKVISPDANGEQGGGITELGEFVEYLVDRDRNVKATTNNPQSSRSHSLIYIELIKSDKGSITYETIITDDGYTRELIKDDITQEPIINGIKRDFEGLEKREKIMKADVARYNADEAPLAKDAEDKLAAITTEIDKFKKKIFAADNVHLFVGDFAGVENSFPCEKVETVKAMLQSEKDPEKYKDRGPFYSIDPSKLSMRPKKLSGGGPGETYKYDPTYGQVADEKIKGEFGKYLTFKESNFYARKFMDFGKGNDEFYANATGLNYDQEISQNYKLPDINMIINIISHLLELNEGGININNINNDIYEKIYNKIKEQPEGEFPGNTRVLVGKIKETATNLKNDIKAELITKQDEGSSTITGEWILDADKKYEILDYRDSLLTDASEFWGNKNKRCTVEDSNKIQDNLEKWFNNNPKDIPEGNALKYWSDTRPFVVEINKVQTVKGEKKTDIVKGRKIYIKNKQQIEDIINNHISGETEIKTGDIQGDFKTIGDGNSDILGNRIYNEDPGRGADMGDVYVFLKKGVGNANQEDMFQNHSDIFGMASRKNLVCGSRAGVKGITGASFAQSSSLWKTKIVEIPGSAIVEFIDKKKKGAESEFDGTRYPVMTKIFKGTNKELITDILNATKYTDNIDYIQEILSTIVIRLSFGKLICENRLLEGKYINHSLKLVRETISDIVSYKNRETISSFPDMVDDNCIQQYKDGAGEDCFKLEEKPIDDSYKIPSEIFQDILGFLKISRPTYTTQNFYDELLVSVFCVLNLNQEPELNPPPTPHIDINEIKEKMYQYNISPENEDKIKEYRESIRKLIDKLKYYGDDTTPGIGIKEDFLNNDDGTLRKYIFGNKPVDLNDVDILTLHKAIEGVLEIIETSNAVTSIGTLEFIDKIAKYQLTETTCMGKHPTI